LTLDLHTNIYADKKKLTYLALIRSKNEKRSRVSVRRTTSLKQQDTGKGIDIVKIPVPMG
jgi:hypothetical protein